MNKLDENTEALLKDGLVLPPKDFRDSVMLNIAAYEREHSQHTEKQHANPIVVHSIPWWQWAALTAGSLIGVGQVFRFIFSVWFVTTAG